MNLANTLAFVVFPYLALTVFTVGHTYRYVKDAYQWNAKSSELLDKRGLFAGSTVFHWGILGTLFGHVGGLLIPQRLFDAVGIDGGAHTEIAYWAGIAVGTAAVIGLIILISRRLLLVRVRKTTTANDWVTVLGLLLVSVLGLYNVFFGHFYVLDTVAPWIRGIVTFRPDPDLMRTVPISYKLHILSALALLGFSPFSRLVHIWSAPLFYVLRSPILFRRRVAGV